MRATAEREDVLRRSKREKERNGENACVRVYVGTCVGAYGDPAALDEWVENQGRNEYLREFGALARNAQLRLGVL